MATLLSGTALAADTTLGVVLGFTGPRVAPEGAGADHLLVLEGDRIFLLGSSGPFPNVGTLNGAQDPDPIEMRVGRTYRLRLIHIQPDWRAHFTLLDQHGFAEWRPVAKDGAATFRTRRVDRKDAKSPAAAERTTGAA